MTYTYYRRYRPRPKRSNFSAFFWLVVLLVTLILVAKGCSFVFSSFAKDQQDEATLTINRGEAQVQEWGEDGFMPAAEAQVFLVGDTIKTGENSLVTLNFYDGTELRLDGASVLTFTEADFSGQAARLELQLQSGRAWVKQAPEDEEELQLVLKTATMNLSSVAGQYLVGDALSKEYVYSIEKGLHVDFVDRAQGDAVIEPIELKEGQKTMLTEDARALLLQRQDLELLGETADDLLSDPFVSWNLTGSFQVDFNPTEDSNARPEGAEANTQTDETVSEETTPEPDEETTPTEVPSAFSIRVNSPGLTATIQKDAIAIEGSIVSGAASTVTVTWGGNNSPYTLGGFAPGDTNFRYVADFDYGNLSHGANTYTVVAYDAAGNPSNTVTVTITAEF